MAGSDQQSSEQFSLVSLEKTQKAAHSYSSMSRRARGESESTLSIHEEEAQERASENVSNTSKTPQAKKPAKSTTPLKKAPHLERDKIDQSLDDILARLEEFQELASTLLRNISQTGKSLALVILSPLISLLNQFLQLLNGPLQFINRLAHKINEKMGGKSQNTSVAISNTTEDTVESIAEPAVSEPDPRLAVKKANFSDMLELNIIFTDNMKKPLYKKKTNAATLRMGAMEEDLIMSNAILAINECAEFTLELPSPSSGLYAGQKIYDIMANVTKEDVSIFLGFVKAFPGKYIGKEWKISETFATWLINNAPTAE